MPPGDGRVTAHPYFERSGNDIVHVHRVNFAQDALGATGEMSTLDGDVDIDVPAGTQTGDVVWLYGWDVPYLEAQNRRGDQLVTLLGGVPAVADAGAAATGRGGVGDDGRRWPLSLSKRERYGESA